MADRDDTTLAGPTTGPRAETDQGATFDAVGTAAREAFAVAIAAGDVSLIPDDAGGLDVVADDWTLHLDGWPGPREAWLAADDEPENPDSATARALLLDALDAATLAALSALNLRLGDRLTFTLRESGDPLSAALADLMPRHGDVGAGAV